MKRLNRILHFDHLDLLGIALALTVVSFRNYFVIPLLVLFLYKIRNHICWLLFWLCIGILLLLILSTQNEIKSQTFRNHVKVISIEHFDYSDRLLVSYKMKRYFIYTKKGTFKIGDQLFIDGWIEPFTKATKPFGFDAQAYYQSQNIFGTIQYTTIDKTKTRFHINSIRQFLIDYYDQQDVSPWVMLMLFGQSLDQESKENYELLGMLHLISVSGIHLYVVAYILKKLFFYLNIKTETQSVLIIFFYALMCYLHQFDIGILRLLLMTLLSHINMHYDLRRSRLEIIQMVFFLILVTHIRHIYFQSLLITYLIITTLALVEPLYRKSYGFKKRMIMTLIVVSLLIPFQNKINLLSLIILPIVSVFLAATLMLGSWFVLLFPQINVPFEWITRVIDQLFEQVIHPKWIIVFGKRSSFWQTLYLLSYFLLLFKQRLHQRIIYLLVMMITIIVPTLNQKKQMKIAFLDVGQGDAIVISDHDCVIVIDAFQGVSDYLMDHGYHQIDYLILTHSDIDHIQEAEALIKKHDVSELIISAYDEGYPFYQMPIKKVKAGDVISCRLIKLHILAPLGEASSANNASVVIQTTLLEQVFLLTGDIEYETEEQLINTYGHALKSDVLKIAHHGSSTSTSDHFLHYVKPRMTIISVGRYNRYEFPHLEVIERITKINATIYRTDLDGSIIYTKVKKKVKWQLHLPF